MRRRVIKLRFVFLMQILALVQECEMHRAGEKFVEFNNALVRFLIFSISGPTIIEIRLFQR